MIAKLIIRNMEMPESCDKCSLFNECWCMALGIGNWRKSYSKPEQGERLQDCPLVPLPEGHGRLIDADSLAESVRQAVGTRGSEEWILDLIEEAEIIVDAREVSDNG